MSETTLSPNFPRITVIGGGHGTAALFPVIAETIPNPTAIISMSDSGGSTGILREAYGLPAMGDVANVITASSRIPEVRSMNGARYTSGLFAGHTPKNITLTLLMEKGVRTGIQEFAAISQANGTFEPVTEQPHDLVLEDGPDNFIRGEHVIDTYEVRSAEPRIFHDPPVRITDAVADTVLAADRIFYAPGSPLTSQLAALCVGGLPEVLHASPAEKVLVVNNMNEQHDTPNWHVVDYVKLLLRHGIPVDTAIYNTATEVVEAAGRQPVGINPERFSELPQVRFIGAAVVSSELGHSGHVVHDAHAILRQLDVAIDKLQA